MSTVNHYGNESNQMDFNLALAIGELKGQVSALNESVSRKMKATDDLSAAVAELKSLPRDIRDMKKSMEDMDSRLRLMEQKGSEQEGKQDMLALILKSPALGWVVGAATLAGGIATGYVHLGGAQ